MSSITKADALESAFARPSVSLPRDLALRVGYGDG